MELQIIQRSAGRKPQGYNPSIDQVANIIASAYEIQPHRIAGKFYGPNVKDGRRMLVNILRKIRPDIQFWKIGEYLNRSYSDVIYLDNSAKDLLFSDKDFIKKYTWVMQEIEILKQKCATL